MAQLHAIRPHLAFCALLVLTTINQVVAQDAKVTGEPEKKVGAEASVVLHSTITGNQEQPKVLHIVPWQGAGGNDQLNTGLQPVLSDVFAPVDRREFLRELKYRQMTTEKSTP